MKKINDHAELIQGLKARNRIVMPSMATIMAKDGLANDFHIQHYGAKAYGGVGTILVEATAVSSEGRILDADLGIWNNKQAKALRKIVDIAHLGGSLIGIQLNHAGAKAQLNQPTLGATMYFDYIDQTNYHLATEKELLRIENDFVKAAKRAKKTGFDFIELHAAHGYLLNQLFHSHLNEIIPSDDILVRGAMIIRLAKRIGEEVNIPVGIRLSASDDLENSPMQVSDLKPLVKALDPYVQYFNISSGSAMGKENIGELIKKTGTKLYRLPYIKEMRGWTKKPLVLAGNFQTRSDVDEALRNKVDFVAIGREQIFNPYIVFNSLLKPNELNKVDYHWNQNPWFNPVDYARMLEKISESK